MEDESSLDLTSIILGRTTVACVRLCAKIRARGCAMAGRVGQIIPTGERIWLVRVFMWRDSESGKHAGSSGMVRRRRPRCASAQAYGGWGAMLGSVFHRNREGTVSPN